MVTHDMGSIIKYCDKVVLLHKGEFIAEGPAGKVVDMYKKILAGKLDDLRAELAAEKAAEEENSGTPRWKKQCRNGRQKYRRYRNVRFFRRNEFIPYRPYA